MSIIRIGLAQINTTVGDFRSNADKVLEVTEKAKALGVDLLTFPELTICGYPPEDLLLKPQFISENLKTLAQITKSIRDITLIVGFVDKKNTFLYNAAAIVHNRKVAGVYHKVCLPNYGVFDEKRYFQADNQYPLYFIGGICVGITICEDIWVREGPADIEANNNADLIVNISASPYHAKKSKLRKNMLKSFALNNHVAVAFTNMVGGQDELVFDGNSMIINNKGKLIAEGKYFHEDLVISDIRIDPMEQRPWGLALTVNTISDTPCSLPKPKVKQRSSKKPAKFEEIYMALMLGTHDYVQKNGFHKVVIGLSGGIDSSLVATIAVDSLGPENVIGVSMPSRYSSSGSIEDATLLANNLGIELLTIPIDNIFQTYLDTFSEIFHGTDTDVTEQNIQARIRGNILMALSNKKGYLVLTTGNKSEIATGYTTLYGDMAGGFAVIKDVPKTMVYDLAQYRNSTSSHITIPLSIIVKEPSAELTMGQKDTDTLPPYSTLDTILKAYVEDDRSADEIIALGINHNVVCKIIEMVDLNEYKRRQGPPGLKISPKAFGRDRRIPITNHFREWYNDANKY